MAFFLFSLALALIPFTGIMGLPFLGELKHELSAHIFLLAMGAAVLFPQTVAQTRQPAALFLKKTYGLPIILAVLLCVIGLSFAANFVTIKDSVFQDRSGLNKLASSTILLFYGFFLAFLTYALAGAHDWSKLILRPLSISVVLCAVFSTIEISGRFIGPIGSFYALLSEIVHGGIVSPVWDDRLRSVASEPPDFANTAGYIWPWLLAAAQFAKGRARFGYLSLWIILSVMIVLSEARTSLVVISGLMLVFLALRFIYLPLHEKADPRTNIPFANLIFFFVLPLGFLFLGLHADDIVRLAISSDRVSNVSRLASMTAAFRMFEEHPFFGFGFGQFGFHVSQYMPSWGFLSYEVREWLSGSSEYWPATYSIYARFGADMGLFGIISWIGIWVTLAYNVLMATLAHRRATGELPFAAYPLIMGCFCVLLAGVPNDSVRAPMIWVNMGLACRYLYELRQARMKRENDT